MSLSYIDMLCIIQKRIVQNAYSLTRCFTSQIINCQQNQPEDHLLRSEDNYTFIRREDTRFLKVAIVGAPNAGKSTLVNQLVNRTVCPTSSKVHTTQTKCNAIYSTENTQLVFIDTPGFITPREQTKFNLNNSFQDDPQASIKIADVVGIIHDAGNRWTRNKLHQKSLDLLNSVNSDIPILLILNKIDQIKDKKILLELIKTLTSEKGCPKLTDVFLISALNCDGVDTLREYLLCTAKSQDWQYNEDTYTDQSPETIIQQTVRAKLMDFLPKEIPYILHSTLEYFEVYPDGRINTSITIECPNKRKTSLLIGIKAQRIKLIAEQCENELRHAFRAPVRLKLNVISKK
ncbi:hypothetical protein KPH14_004185 [Odynerus spinipes]|uniref:GTPase Era, mitochondrial n=1 Tax=Odynerus spinipes TaxID=1348599 RepID=A0AAD9RY62_9HYME|nr:hypothetical protein KPH14_004185 [Odynerus spinipes]